ncbi:MAG TPA: hypothetical protein VG758_25755 [Hyphomicrobiaceae bacterium]|jgi:hypothetical protein|nr:hypothetical protein [Hyphomicrobiaceae bacterium]
MGVHIVMDRSGDTRHEFDASDAKAVALAEKRFKELTGKGFRAVALAKDGGPGSLQNKFDPQVEQTLFIPQLQGG